MPTIEIAGSPIKVILGSENIIVSCSDWNAVHAEADRDAGLVRKSHGGPSSFGAISYFCVPLSQCDCCGKSFPVQQMAACVAYGIDTWACVKCRNADPEDEG